MIFGISIEFWVSAHSGQKFVFLYYCYLLPLSALFKNLERFTTCMIPHFRLVRTFFRTLHAHLARNCVHQINFSLFLAPTLAALKNTHTWRCQLSSKKFELGKRQQVHTFLKTIKFDMKLLNKDCPHDALNFFLSIKLE